jgi:hypothetical protein
MALTREQFNDFHDALIDAYDLDGLTLMLGNRLRQKLANLVDVAKPFPVVVFRLIQVTEGYGWAPTLRLINAALESRPENLKLLRFAQQFQFQLSASSPALERQVRQDLDYIDIDAWVAGLGRAQARVCRVLVQSAGDVTRGSGFLVGSDVVVTNHHVVERVIKGELAPAAVKVQFDYKFLANGTALSNGTPYALTNDRWLIDSSPSSKWDTKANPGNKLPEPDELDYALLRLDGKPGDLPINPGSAEPGAPPRGWIDVPVGDVALDTGAPLFIIQHPEGLPVKLALDTKAVLGVNGNRTRVRYTTNTEAGSSGSPCFDAEWGLLALHHSGDPNYKRSAQWNEGIPIDAIVRQVNARLRQRGQALPWGKQR